MQKISFLNTIKKTKNTSLQLGLEPSDTKGISQSWLLVCSHVLTTYSCPRMGEYSLSNFLLIYPSCFPSCIHRGFLNSWSTLWDLKLGPSLHCICGRPVRSIAQLSFTFQSPFPCVYVETYVKVIRMLTRVLHNTDSWYALVHLYIFSLYTSKIIA